MNDKTATTEPIDRRWFEDALRAQGFLVETPDVEDDPWQEPPSIEPEPASFAWLGPQTEPEPEPEPLTLELEPEPEPEPEPAEVPLAANAAPEPEPEPEPAEVPLAANAAPEPQSVEARLAPAVAAPDSDEHPWDTAAPPPVAPWPVMGDTPTRVIATAVVPTAPVAVVAARQAVAPTTLATPMPPVPTAALAARLSRSTVAAPVELAEVPATAPVSTPPVDHWAQPEARLDLDAPPLTDTATVTGDQDRDGLVTASIATAAVGTGVATTEVVDASSAEMTARAEADLQAQESSPIVAGATGDVVAATDLVAEATDMASPSVELVEPVEPGVISPAAMAAASAVAQEPAIPFAPPPTGTAAVATRPPIATVGTTVDGGESDLWGLVDDPRRAAAPTGAPAAESRSSRLTTIALTVIVAFVVVALVLGFLYLLTDLL